MKSYSFLLIAFLLLPACKSSRIQEEPEKIDLVANPTGKGPAINLEFSRGPAHNHPSFVLMGRGHGRQIPANPFHHQGSRNQCL